MSRRGRLSSKLVLAALAGGWIVACAPSAEDAAPDPLTIESAVDTVDVALLEYAIGMRSRLPAGAITLKLSNQGFEMHNLKLFATDAATPLWETTTDINPGETRVVTIDVPPGTYRVVCDVAGHDARGMQMDLKVEESAR